jgi:hypothetical protein
VAVTEAVVQKSFGRANGVAKGEQQKVVTPDGSSGVTQRYRRHKDFGPADKVANLGRGGGLERV